MSALNVLVERDGAHLLTDAAVYDAAGVVRLIGSKVVVSDQLGVAIGFSGRAHPSRIVAELEALGPSSGAELLNVLPALTAGVKRSNEADDGLADVQLVMIAFDHTQRRGRAFLCSTSRAWMGSDFPVNQAVEIDQLIVPQVDVRAVAGGAPLRAVPHGRHLLEAQRRTPFDVAGGRQWCVGGFGERTSVTARGVERVELVRWPDVVGRKVREAA